MDCRPVCPERAKGVEAKALAGRRNAACLCATTLVHQFHCFAATGLRTYLQTLNAAGLVQPIDLIAEAAVGAVVELEAHRADGLCSGAGRLTIDLVERGAIGLAENLSAESTIGLGLGQ